MSARRRAAALFALLPLAACLPPSAIGRAGEIPADRYALDLRVDVTTTGVDLAPFTRRWIGTLDVAPSAQLPDGTLARAVCLDVEPEEPLDGACFELRGFLDGPAVAVEPLEPRAGVAGGLESLDLLWLALAPPIVARGGARDASWPSWVEGVAHLQLRSRLAWTPDGPGRWTGHGDVAGDEPAVSVAGPVDLVVEVEPVADRLAAVTARHPRRVRTRWAKQVEQEEVWSLALRWQSAVPTAVTPRVDVNARAAAAHRVLPDGTEVGGRDATGRDSLAYLLLPADLPAERVAALRAALLGAGTMVTPELGR